MIAGLRRVGLLALYQVAVAVGILLMPVALAARQVGVNLPIRRVVDALGTAYDEARAG